jgi:TonB family protein
MPVLFLLTVLFFAVRPSYGASMAAVDVNEGYGSKILDRLNSVWAPPNLKGNFRLRMKIAVDGGGKVRECAIVASSGMEALDTSACGAVRQINKFDTPPYGVPCEIYVSFWTGLPKGNTRELPPDPMEALRAEMIERDKAERAAGKQRADATEERAREKAEQAAKRTGRPLPEVRPRPAGPPMAEHKDKTVEQTAPPVPAAQQEAKRADKILPGVSPRPADPARQQRRDPPAAQDSGSSLTAEEQRLTMPDAAAGDAARRIPPPLRTGQGAPVAADSPPQAAHGEKMRKYVSNIHWHLLTAVIIPAETAPGEYHATVQLRINADGSVAKYELVRGTGDALLDKYVLRGVGRAGNLPPPPPAFDNPVELTFTLRRR